MASDDPKAGGFSSRPARTPPTLDLKAEEVATAPATAPAAGAPSTDSPAPATEPAAGEADAREADAVAAEGNAVEAAPVSAEQAAEAAIEEPAKPAAAAAPARSGSGAGAVFAALLAGAVAGGGVAGGLWYAMGALTPPPAAAPKPVVDLAPLQNRIAALEARPTADAGAIAALTARLEKSEAALKALESTVAALKGAPAAAAAQAPAVPPSLLKSVEDLKAAAEATRTALAAATKEIETVRAAQASFQSAIATASGGAQQALTQAQQASAQVQQATTQSQAVASRLDAVGPRLDALKKQIEDASAAATQFNRAAAGLVVLSTFREAVVSGRPFATELGAAKATLGANAAQLDAFAAIAPDGFAPPAKLAERLAKEGAAAIGAAAPPPADAPVSLVDRLMASAESLVKVRPASGPGAVDAESMLATAVGLVKTGQLDDALRVLKQLPDAVQARLAVVRDIEARASALRLAGMLYQQQLAAISGKMP